MMFRTPTAIAVAATAALLLAACSGTAGSSGGMSGMAMSETPAPSAISTSAGSFNTQDVMFARMMSAHHLQAVEMADSVLKKTGVDPRVTALATTIEHEQQPEITRMNGWLTSWGAEPVTSSMGGMGSGSGMMSMDEMDALDKASGAKASSLFLTGMITHHTGAIAMAETEIGTGENADAIALAKSITSSQTAQITQMKKLLAGL